jgi:hypothetical protein
MRRALGSETCMQKGSIAEAWTLNVLHLEAFFVTTRQ